MKNKETTQLNKSLRTATIKLILGGVALLLLFSALIYITFAWYTKMVSVSGMKFEVAKWDFNANYSESEFYVNVYKFAEIADKKVAPGTSGYIPLQLGAGQSEADVSFAISIDRSAMSEEFKERIFFYYYKNETDAANNNKTYIGGAPGTASNNENDSKPIEGTIKQGGSQELMIYWEWIYEYPKETDSVEANNAAVAWDEFDTNVGKNPKLYAADMNAKISIVGVEIKPTKDS